MLQHNTERSCSINYLISEENQQKEKSENIWKNADNQKIVQQKYCDNNQHEENEETAEAE